MAPEDCATNANDETGKYRMLILSQWEHDEELSITLMDKPSGESFLTTDVMTAQDLVEVAA